MGESIQLDDWRQEQEEWLEALEEVLEAEGKVNTAALFQRLRTALARRGVANGGQALNTAYLNTIAVDEQPVYPGNLDLEQRLENVLRWNAQAMVLRAYDKTLELGGHIATYAASATITEVLFNHFLRKKSDDYGGDTLMIQGHASPGVYARAVLEGRISIEQIAHFRQELTGGVASYPHPRRMPNFWQAPTVSMGLGPLMAIYQARFMRYLETRGLKPANGGRIWHFLGDGEIDEPEIFGTIGVASRENLDNLTFIVNCNLQRLDGPVRGNGKIIQEVERMFLGAGWEVIKVLWGSEWDPLFAKDTEGALLTRLETMVDGDFQELVTLPGAKIREKLVNGDQRIAAILADLSDEQIERLRRGGHDPLKVYAAYKRAVETQGKPVAILVQTVKGYGLGKAAEGRNDAHQVKNLLREYRLATWKRYGIDNITEDEAGAATFWFPPQDDPAIQYMHERRRALGGYLPERTELAPPIELPDMKAAFGKQLEGSERDEKGNPREFSTTSAVVGIMTSLIRDAKIGKLIVPIVPDEAQTFGMQPLFNSAQIWNQQGQKYTPLPIKIDVIKYKESKTGQVLQEGINELGATGSFAAAGTAYAVHGVPTIPFYIYYSMFGFQRVGDLVWATADMMGKGFLLGGTAGRTTLNGEGLQHQDGHSHIHFQTVPSVMCYDPAFAYELAVIVHDGLRRMYVENEKKIYYITVYNENYAMPAMPEGVEEGIVRGMYRFKAGGKASAKKGDKPLKANLFGSGSIMKQVLEAAAILEAKGVSTDIWSVTSWTELYRDAEACLRWNLLHPGEPERVPYVMEALRGTEGVYVSANDWIKLTAHQLAKWMPQDFIALGTDGFGLSESREALRDYFEISPKYIAFTALRLLQKQGKVNEQMVKDFMKEFGIEPDKIDPMSV